jgi:hypothetical protein
VNFGGSIHEFTSRIGNRFAWIGDLITRLNSNNNNNKTQTSNYERNQTNSDILGKDTILSDKKNQHVRCVFVCEKLK